MNNVTTVSRVRAVNYRAAVKSSNRISPKPIRQTAKKPELPLVEEVQANLYKNPHGALGKLTDNLRDFAATILRPKSCLVGEKQYETSAAQSRKCLTAKQTGAAAGIRNALRKYAEAAIESVGPPAEIADAIKTFHIKARIPSFIDYLEKERHVDMLV